MSALEMSPEKHLVEACNALDVIKDYPRSHGSGGVTEVAASLSAYATAHLMAAQVKMQMGAGMPYGTMAWEKEES